MERTCPKCFQKYPDDVARCPDCNKKLLSLIDRDLVGQELDDRYLVKRVLGRGGMGVVYIAEQSIVGRKVALKVLRRDTVQDEASVKRFFTEAKAIASLKNPHTITLHDFGITDDGLVYYTMELLEGRPLSKVIKDDGPLEYQRAADIIFQTLESLEEAHGKEILHRDLKPENLFVSQRKGKDFVTVLDFGIAKLVGDSSIETVTKTGMICGTPAYLSPEQVMGNPAVRASDLYALAIVLYEMLAGEPPFFDTTAMKLLLRQLNEQPVPVSVKNPHVEVPRPLDEFLLRAMKKTPEERFQTVDSFRQGLRRALDMHQVVKETSRLSPMVTTSDGLRSIQPGTAGYETAIVDIHEQETEPDAPTPRDRVDVTAETGVVELPISMSSLLTDEKTVDLGQRKKNPKRWLLGGIGVGVALAAVLALWQPWSAGPREAGDGRLEAGATTRTTETETRKKAEQEAEARRTAEAEAIAKEEAEEEAGGRRLEAGAKAVETETESKKAEEEAEARRKAEAEALAQKEAEEEARLKAEEEAEARRKAEAEALAKKEAEEEAKKKAEEEAEARRRAEAEAVTKRKAEAEAVTKRKADAEAVTKRKADAERKSSAEAVTKEKISSENGLGFRAVKVKEEPPKDDGGGLGFRPVKVKDSAE